MRSTLSQQQVALVLGCTDKLVQVADASARAGKTPKAIIDEYIVKEIERELSTTTHTVQEIANTFGFSS